VCAQLRAGALAVVNSHGIDGVTFERLCVRTGVWPTEIGRHYETAEACLYDAYEEVARSIYEDFAAAFKAEKRWRQALRLGSHTLLQRLNARPTEAKLCFVEILHGGHELLRRRDANRRRLVDLFVSELGRRRERPEQSRIQLELLIGAGFQAIAQAVTEGRLAELSLLEPELESRAFVFEPDAAQPNLAPRH
jgi:AcrR family transcriptional regulator